MIDDGLCAIMGCFHITVNVACRTDNARVQNHFLFVIRTVLSLFRNPDDTSVYANYRDYLLLHFAKRNSFFFFAWLLSPRLFFSFHVWVLSGSICVL